MIKTPANQFYCPAFSPFDNQPIAWVFLRPLTDSEPYVKSFSSKSSKSEENIEEIKKFCSPVVSPTYKPAFFESTTSIESEFKLGNNFLNNKSNKSDEEEEFKPNSHEPKKPRRAPQNANRNVVPNIMHQVISYLQKKSKSSRIVSELINKLGLQEVCTTKRFFLYQLLIKEKLNHYVNAESLTILKELQEPLCEIYSANEQMSYNKISRFLVNYFLTREFDSLILTSKRVHTDKKFDHLTTKRKILEQVSEMFQE